MVRGLTHPTAHVGKTIKHLKTNKEYVYVGFEFSRDVMKLVGKVDKIIDEVGDKKKTGAVFFFKEKTGSKKAGVVYYAASVSVSSNINAGKLGMQYSGAKGATENLGIQASNLILGGKSEKLTINGQDGVSCKTFTDIKTLHKSVLDYMKKSNKVGNHIVDSVDGWFKSASLKNFDWQDDSFQDSEINELGKYLGEIIIGAVALKNKSSLISQNPFNGKAKKFIVPDDPSFSGVDSAVMLNDGTLVPISSKAGVGAKASIFTNFLPKVIDKQKLPKSVIKDLVESAKRAGITRSKLDAKQGSKEIVYEYGVRDILGLSKSQVSDPYAVYTEIRQGSLCGILTDFSAPPLKVISAIANHKDIPNNVKDALPLSVTSAFNREIARRLNEDKVSQDIVANILAGKNFYQANLDLNKWKKGEVYFKLLLSGNAKTSFIGSKAAINDIDAKQGLVNYELKY
jgi:hypothetical protein